MVQEPELSRRRFQQEEDDGRVAIIGWLRHPGVTELIARKRPVYLQLVAPLDRLLPDQLAVFRFALRAAGDPHRSIAIMGPDFVAEDNEWAKGLPAATPGERSVAGVILAVVNELSRVFAREIEKKGAPIDPESPLDLVVLVQLLLMDIDLGGSTDEIVDQLILFGPSGITHDGRGIGDHRDGRANRGVARVEAIRGEFRERSGGKKVRAPYARGGNRSTPATAQKRREALRTVLAHFPEATPKAILNSWRSGSPSKTAGSMLRAQLEAEIDEAPSLSTLEKDFAALKQPPISP